MKDSDSRIDVAFLIEFVNCVISTSSVGFYFNLIVDCVNCVNSMSYIYVT